MSDAAGAATHLVTESASGATAVLHERAAKRMLRVLGDMKGLPLKAGQMLSYVDEMIPDEHRAIYQETLGKLQMHTPTMDWDVVREVFHQEFDGRDPTDVFKEFNPAPIAAASIRLGALGKRSFIFASILATRQPRSVRPAFGATQERGSQGP